MKFKDYIALAMRTEKPLPKRGRVYHGCMGLITEVGEIVSDLKRIAIYEKPLDQGMKDHIVEECGDAMWYLAILADATITNLHIFEVPTMDIPDDWEYRFQEISLLLASNAGLCCGIIRSACARTDGLHIHPNTEWEYEMALSNIVAALRLLCIMCNSDLETTMDKNIAKLQKRFPDAYSNEAAEGRADKGGLDARNS